MKGIVILGAGGHAKVVLSTALAAGLSVEGIFDDDDTKWGQKLLDVPVLGPLEMLRSERLPRAVIAIGDNRVRKRIVERFDGCCEWITVVHPRAFVHQSVRVGRGTVIFVGTVIQPDTVVGDHVILNTGVTVDHDCTIGSFVHLAPGVHLAGSVVVEEGGFLGIGSVVIPGQRVGQWATVGAGAVVVRDVPPLTTVAGIPAKPLVEQSHPLEKA
ncbi:MAG: acetyltransferase [Candidatus Caldatribacteriaceae bacterium]